MNTLLRGLWAGVMATSSMTISLFQAFKSLPFLQKAPLPPALLSREIGEKTGLAKNLTSQQQQMFTMVSHFGYGAAAGAVYAILASKLPGNPVIKGSLFGVGVWLASYYGLIPSMGLSTSAPNMTKKRNFMMFASHIVWGISLGYAEQELRRRGSTMLDGRRNPVLAK
ncbi:hypothetical protein AZI87_16725 [Bdellovibrio bacteriovorus]|uniref:DUF1440 domain-containing protein n=1 Tax=Bdellovibrio bacteriovorus TaxID=959 RepID=A0A162G018_BDEBC|nr:DUF6789 family protein [Bdellovibrio bacteriovorus]KYG62910.1 hypothetical protein AZI87_16725 [Bdellovibrio bacteriovorus]